MDAVRQHLAVTLPWSFLRCDFRLLGALARPAVPVAWTIAAVAIASVPPIKSITTAVVAVAIAFAPAHHGGGAFLVRVDPDREIAHNVFVEPFQPLDLVDRGRRRI